MGEYPHGGREAGSAIVVDASTCATLLNPATGSWTPEVVKVSTPDVDRVVVSACLVTARRVASVPRDLTLCGPWEDVYLLTRRTSTDDRDRLGIDSVCADRTTTWRAVNTRIESVSVRVCLAKRSDSDRSLYRCGDWPKIA